jgi:hypothetical protein
VIIALTTLSQLTQYHVVIADCSALCCADIVLLDILLAQVLLAQVLLAHILLANVLLLRQIGILARLGKLLRSVHWLLLIEILRLHRRLHRRLLVLRTVLILRSALELRRLLVSKHHGAILIHHRLLWLLVHASWLHRLLAQKHGTVIGAQVHRAGGLLVAKIFL